MKCIAVIDKYGQNVVCKRCSIRLPMGESIADLDGPAFRNYYHPACAREEKIEQDAIHHLAEKQAHQA